jgi:hypothetical protein
LLQIAIGAEGPSFLPIRRVAKRTRSALNSQGLQACEPASIHRAIRVVARGAGVAVIFNYKLASILTADGVYRDPNKKCPAKGPGISYL